jgi:UDPglucose 6-dehydrogenase
MDVKSAELTKYAANAMLATKISFMNELANLAERFGADIEKVRVGIGSDPRIGYHFIYPGLGYGGSCFPKDVQALGARRAAWATSASCSTRRSGEQGAEARAVREDHEALRRQSSRQDLRDLGPGVQAGTDDMREAPSRVLDRALWARARRCGLRSGAQQGSEAHLGRARGPARLKARREALDGADALVIVTEWKEFRSPDFDYLKKTAQGTGDLRRPQLVRPGGDERSRASSTTPSAGRGRRVTPPDALKRVRCRLMKLVPVILSGGRNAPVAAVA